MMPKWLSYLGFTLASHGMVCVQGRLRSKCTGHNMCGFSDRLTAQNKGVIISQSLKDTLAIVFHQDGDVGTSRAPQPVEEDGCYPRVLMLIYAPQRRKFPEACCLRAADQLQNPFKKFLMHFT